MAGSIAQLKQAPAAGLDVESALRRTKARMSEPQPRVLTSPRWHQRLGWESTAVRAAAVVLIVAGAGLLWRRTQVGEKGTGTTGTTAVAVRTISTGVGQRDSVELPDGTRVILGPSTTLTQHADFGKNTREVDLAGEAYFDVKHDASREFRVNTPSALIRDIGTTFDVQTTGATDVRVAVTSGTVLVRPLNRGTQDSVVLRAGDRGGVNGGRVVAERAAVTEADLAWMRGKLIFRDTPLTEAADQIRRWYGVELRFADPALRNQHLTATFAGEPKSQVLKTIALALGAEIELRGDTAILHAHGY
jgi:transmembrane sensor